MQSNETGLGCFEVSMSEHSVEVMVQQDRVQNGLGIVAKYSSQSDRVFK